LNQFIRTVSDDYLLNGSARSVGDGFFQFPAIGIGVTIEFQLIQPLEYFI
jgi:hypothetical protein